MKRVDLGLISLCAPNECAGAGIPVAEEPWRFVLDIFTKETENIYLIIAIIAAYGVFLIYEETLTL